MARTSKNAAKHIVSVRVNDLEREALDELADAFGMNISTLLRESLKLLEEAYLNGNYLEEAAGKRIILPDM